MKYYYPAGKERVLIGPSGGHIPSPLVRLVRPVGIYPLPSRLACDASGAKGEGSGREWGTRYGLRKGEGSLGC